LSTDPEARVRFSAIPEKKVVGLERGSLSLVSTTEELVDGKVAAPVYKTENTAVGIRHADHVAPSIRKKVGNHFADQRRSLGRYSSLAKSDHGGFFYQFQTHSSVVFSLLLPIKLTEYIRNVLL
jgi:hypothetical protein